MRWIAHSVVLMAVSVVAGCLDAGPAPHPIPTNNPPSEEPRLHSVAEIVPFAATASDGVVLRGHVYLPDGEGPFATVLEYSPYWNTNEAYGESEGQVIEVQGRKTLDLWLGRFLDAGFAVALVNPRGAGESGGCYPFGLLPEPSDAYTVVEGLAAQAWSNGNVGMIGLSASAGTQIQALAARPPALKAVIPVSGGLDLWNTFGRNGATLGVAAPAIIAGYGMWASGALSGRIPPDTGRDHFTCPEAAAIMADWAVWGANGDRNAYFMATDMRPHVENSPVPTLYADALLPWQEGGGTSVDYWWDLLAGDKRILLGQWGHAYPDGDSPDPENDFFTYGQREDWGEMTVAWMDHYLRGGPQRVEPGVVEYQDPFGGWHSADRWPPRANHTILRLSEGVLLEESAPVLASSQTFQSQHDDPRPETCPGTQALFVSPRLASDVLIAGYFQANLTLTSDLPDGNLAAFLYRASDVFPCGRHREAWLASGSMTGGVPEVEVGRALGDLRHVNGNDAGADFPLLTPKSVSMRSVPFAAKVLAGDRVILAIGGGSLELTPDVKAPHLTVTTGPGVVGEINLPVVEGRLAFTHEANTAGWNAIGPG